MENGKSAMQIHAVHVFPSREDGPNLHLLPSSWDHQTVALG
jgi:hypothetical protein